MEQCCINVDNVESTLHQCCISTLIQHNHMTLNQRCFNVDSTPCAHWECNQIITHDIPWVTQDYISKSEVNMHYFVLSLFIHYILTFIQIDM